MQDFMQDETEEKDDSGLTLINLEQAGERPKTKTKSVDKKSISLLKEILDLLANVAITVVVLIILKEYVIINAYIPSGSMENTIMPKDRVIGNRLAYLFSEPERGDIVIFKYPDDETQLFVKRIIGLPGETVTIEDAKVYIGEEQIRLEEPYLKEEWVIDNGSYTFEIPEGSYLMLGDNRNNSKDSRYWDNTYVEEEKILGKAVFRYWPFSSFGTLE